MKNDIERLEKDLWEAADNLRANSKLTSSDYFMPVLGVIFLRYAANRFDAATRQIEEDQAAGRMPKRQVFPEDYLRRRALWLPSKARYDWIMEQAAVSGADLPGLVTEAMTAIEAEFEPLLGVLPKDYGIFETKALEDLMRLFNSEQIKKATGDVFGRTYEYFLAKFSIQKAHDNGEFFTPSSIVQTIVNVIEPDHGTVFDPACGSGGMFVQSSHFIEHEGGDTAKKVVFYGQEKNRDTIHIAKMNLAVHGLEGKIAEAITYYQDEHNLAGKCDFVMANPPFNVDLVDAERIKGDPRLPFGLPGVNKQKKVGNGNYLWISYFWSYLNEKGRAGFVMSSQASSAGHGEKEVRRKIVETGDVDVMISIRSNFFYTRTVPCELWFFDRAKPSERKDKALMLDARNIYRKVTRKIYDFSPEQMHNLAAIVWLYRGQRERFLGLVKHYLGRICAESVVVPGALAPFDTTLADLRGRFDALAKAVAKHTDLEADRKHALAEVETELREAATLYEADAEKLLTGLHAYARSCPPTRSNVNAKSVRGRQSSVSSKSGGSSGRGNPSGGFSNAWKASLELPLAFEPRRDPVRGLQTRSTPASLSLSTGCNGCPSDCPSLGGRMRVGLPTPANAACARIRELLREAEEVAPDLQAGELSAILGEIERLRVVLWIKLNAVPLAAEPAEPDRLLEVSEAAERLSVSPDTLYRKARDFPFTVRLGHLVRFSSAGIDRFIRTRQGR